ncbi:hypothetical protein H7849_20560 [Alloacidobacterium dinghuense]|uniref:DUF5666 domain-containing protein n=1 Tax=Alloacidobacterium dinghuense TaxID=2763107 RepID=A0A7G8BFX3_9BACT|nr:hypothetical protein [Alloacidobacterium dinghuense]QNI31443.1 hypothetical protein H7849_20560 [Alloacidobacterium dinghuense]
MKKSYLFPFAAMIAILLSPAVAHGQDASGNTTGRINMVSARTWLSKDLDTKKARPGDLVILKLMEEVKIPDAPSLPGNTVLVGHVDQVQPSVDKGDSMIQVTFDKAQLKNGQQIPVKATIIRVSPPATLTDQASPSLEPHMPMASQSGVTGTRTPSGSTPMAAPTGQASSSEPTNQPACQIAGVELKSDIHDAVSGTFTSKRRNIQLSGGTLIQLAIAVIPANTDVR